MKKITLKTWAVLLSLCVFVGANAADRVLPLDAVNLISDGGKVTYDNPTITYLGAPEEQVWQYAGWEWASGEDFSAYNTLVAEFDASGLPDVGDPAKIQFSVVYVGGNNDGDAVTEVRKSANSAVITLDPARANQVYRIYLKSQYAGTIELKSVFATNVEDTDIPLWNINWQEDGKWNYLTKTISNIDGCDSWRRITMDGLNKTITGEVRLVLEFDNLASTCVENPENYLQLIAETDADNGDNGNYQNSGATTTTANGITTTKTAILEGATIIRNIHIKLRDTGTANLIRMYLETDEIIELDDMIKNPAGKLGFASDAFTTYTINNEFTLAVDLTNTNLAAWLTEGENRGVAIQIWHGGIAATEAEYLRLAAPITGNIWGEAVTLQDLFELPETAFVDGATTDFYVVAFGFIYGSDGLWDVNYETDWYKFPTGLFGSDSAPYADGTNINTLEADEATIVGYFSITGAKLSTEPANGLFIIKYSNGKAVKVVK